MRVTAHSAKIVLITGASTGIGAELAKCFAQDGYSLILVAQNQERLEAFAQDLYKKYRVRIKTFTKDLSKRKSSEEMYEELLKHNLEVDILVNNVGVGLYGKFTDRTFAEHTSLYNLNMFTPTYLTHLLLPHMIERNEGKILNVASTAAFQPGPLMATYYASKAFMLSWSQALSEELQNTHITVTALCPGPTYTEFQKKQHMETSLLFQKGLVMKAEDVARIGYQGMMKGKRVVIPGFRNQLIIFLQRFLSRKYVTKLAGNLTKKK